MIDSENKLSLGEEKLIKPMYEKPVLTVLSTDQTEVGTVVVSETAPFGS